MRQSYKDVTGGRDKQKNEKKRRGCISNQQLLTECKVRIWLCGLIFEGWEGCTFYEKGREDPKPIASGILETKGGDMIGMGCPLRSVEHKGTGQEIRSPQDCEFQLPGLLE